MRRFIFTAEVQQALAKDRSHHPDPRVQQRMEIVLLKSKGETHERMAELAGVSRRTFQRVLDGYEEEGLDGLRKFYWHGQASALTPHRDSLEAEFCARPPHTVSEACQRIEELNGVRRKQTRVRKFFAGDVEVIGLSAIHVGQTFLSGIKSLVLLADGNVCPTSIHKNGGDLVIVAKGGRRAGAAEADRGGTCQKAGSFFTIKSLNRI